mmetsp:Transcript_7055/g.12792  ORF Transcript_7055/g.12792 Transcript_7055/m.12792 type:complete len:471 (+) Transcript_7055:45-1457(+)
MENTTCSHSPFRRPHYSSWPKRILLSINSRRRLAQLVPYSKWIYLDGHQGVDLNQMQKQFSVESFLRCSMSSTATIRLHHFPRCGKKRTEDVKDSWRVSIDPKPNARENPVTFALDPYGAGDFFCKFCYEELSNVYMHCDGCEKLLNKDFNICSSCHMEGKYKIFHKMHPFNVKPQSILNHTGNKHMLRRGRCPCKNGKECQYCGYCTGCSCRCHQWFTLHYRFMDLEYEQQLLHHAESIVGSEMIPEALETKARLFSLIPGDLTQEVVPNNADICQVMGESRPEKGNGGKKVFPPLVNTEVSQYYEETNKQKSSYGGMRKVCLGSDKTDETNLAGKRKEKKGNSDESKGFQVSRKLNKTKSAGKGEAKVSCSEGGEKEGIYDKFEVFQARGKTNGINFTVIVGDNQERSDKSEVFQASGETNETKSAGKEGEKEVNSADGFNGNNIIVARSLVNQTDAMVRLETNKLIR